MGVLNEKNTINNYCIDDNANAKTICIGKT